jgi:F-type H+-transporting ATPase subunit delta
MSAQNTKVAQPYANAFIDMAGSSFPLDFIISDLNNIATALTESSDLRKVIGNPLVSSTTKKEILKSIFAETIDKTTVNFLLVLCDRGRINCLTSIVKIALEVAYKKASIDVAYVITSTEMSNSQQEALITKLKEMTKTKEIKLNIKIDESLIGGFTVQLGSKIIDTSLRGQLRELSSYLGASAN